MDYLGEGYEFVGKMSFKLVEYILRSNFFK